MKGKYYGTSCDPSGFVISVEGRIVANDFSSSHREKNSSVYSITIVREFQRLLSSC
jgi:hypothetical protein